MLKRTGSLTGRVVVRVFLVLGLCIVVWSAQAQTAGDGTDQPQVNCADPLLAASASCQIVTGAGQRAGDSSSVDMTGRAPDSQRGDGSQVYVDSAGTNANQRALQGNRPQTLVPQDRITDFQRLTYSSTGELLPIFGRDLFQHVPSTFAPAEQIPVTSDYVIGPGDQLLVRLWGPETLNSQLTVDTTGAVFIPKVGSIQVAGLRYDQLQKQISTEVSRIYRNFQLSVTLGKLRSIQVYVVGEARQPGAYTVSSLSTVLNVLLTSGGPNAQGSMRAIQVRRGGQPVMEFDLYDLLLRGDKTKDFRLEQGDTIFIPAVGAQVALAGSVRHPAVYELRGKTAIPDLLRDAGGLTPTATGDHIRLERIDVDHTRKALTLAMDAEGRLLELRDGDVLFVNHISPSYQQSVTIRGNLANPGRFPWHTGMRLSEIIPDRMSLLTNDYWRDRNRLGVPVPLFEPLSRDTPGTTPGAATKRSDSLGMTPEAATNRLGTTPPGYIQPVEDTLNSQALRAQAAALDVQSAQLPGSANDVNQLSRESTIPLQTTGLRDTSISGQSSPDGQSLDSKLTRVLNKIDVPTAEIDWSYAVIERLDPNTLKTQLLPFNLGHLVQNHDSTQDLELQPGDVVTILSQADIAVPQEERTKYIRLEGEFASAGVYSVRPGESLADVVRRAGGLSSKAYLYGSSFLRESARVFQQQRLDEYISSLAADLERAAAVRAASSSTGILDPNAIAQQRTLISQLRQLKATGRVVLEFLPDSSTAASIPTIALENGDVFRIPSRPSTVSVIGAVYGQNVFLYNQERRVEDYVKLAGQPKRIADRHHAFIIRADGSIYSRDRAQGIWSNGFNNAHIYPGDAIVIPEKPIRPTVLRELIDYSQILSSFGLAAAAINVIR